MTYEVMDGTVLTGYEAFFLVPREIDPFFFVPFYQPSSTAVSLGGITKGRRLDNGERIFLDWLRDSVASVYKTEATYTP